MLHSWRGRSFGDRGGAPDGSYSVSDGQHAITIELSGKAGVTQAPSDLERNIALAGEPVRRPGVVK